MERGTNPDKSPGYYLVWKTGDRMFIVWLLNLQVELYFLPVDWSIKYDRQFGLLGMGPICLNWSEDD